MRPRILAGIASLVLMLSSPMTPAYADASCEPLNRLLTLAGTQFNRLRGYFDPRLQAWVSTYRMPGASLCTIQDTETTAYFSCEWVHDPESGGVTETYTGLVRQVLRCVDVGGTSHEQPTPESQTIRFGVEGARRTIVLARTESVTEGYFVTLDIVPLGLGEFPGD